MFKKTLSHIGIYLILFNLFSAILFSNEANANQNSISNSKKQNSIIENKKNYSDDRLIVKFKPNKGVSTMLNIKNTFAGAGLSKADFFDKVNMGVLSFDNTLNNIDSVITELKKNNNVEYAEYDYVRNLDYIGVNTNDTNSINQWYLKSIQADDAWKIYNDNENKITVSVNDTGINYTHPDLIGNLKDLSTNCISDTGAIISGGCPNNGWNFEGNGNYNSLTAVLAENESFDLNGHGTHVAGTIGAVGDNGTGVIGVTQNVELMSARIETYENNYALFYVSNTIRALNFAIQNGAKVVNASYGGTSYSQAEYDAIDVAKTNGLLMLVASGNISTNNDGGTHFYPSDYDLDNIISVASIGNDDTLAYYSNYGVTSVDLASPGGDMTKDSGILSTYPFYETIWSNNMDSFSGITLSGTGLNWNIYNGLFTDLIESQSGAYLWNSTYTGSEDKILSFDNTFDLSSAKFAKFDGYFECELSAGDDLEVLINDQVIGNASTIWNYNRASNYGNVVLPIPSNLYTTSSQLKIRFTSNSDGSQSYGCSLDNFSIIKYDDSKSKYNYLQGTSMATPVVTGVASMIWSYKPELSYLDIKDIIFSSLDILPSLSGKVLTSGKLNAKNAIKELISRYGITKNGSFDGETFNIPNINLDGKNISLSGSIINITSTGTVLTLSGSSITGSGIINIGTGTSINNFSTTSNFDIILKNSSGALLDNSGSTIYGESLIISSTGTLSGTGVNIRLSSGVNELYNGPFSSDLLIPISSSFSGGINSYLYKNGDESIGISTGVLLNILNKTTISNINFYYVPSVFTGTLDFNSGNITNNTGTYINLSSTIYPVDYTITGDIVGTYTGTLNNSGSILVELVPGDGIKTLSGVIKNLNNQFSNIFTNSIELDQTAPIVSITANTSTGVSVQSIEFTASSNDSDFNISNIIWSNNLNGITGSGSTYTVSGETSTGLIVTANFSDNVGNTGIFITDAYIIDNTGPDAPTNFLLNDGGVINLSNVTNLQLSGSASIIDSGATVFYTFTDSSGTGILEGSSNLVGDSFYISNLNLSSLSDGNIEYSAYLVDNVGNTGSIATGSTIKETLAPTGSFVLGTYSNSTLISLNLDSSEYPINYLITGDIVSTVSGSLSASGTINIDLVSGDGIKNVNIIYTDSGNNNSPTYSGSIILDQTNPVINILSHNNDENVVSNIITLTGTVTDSNISNTLTINGELLNINSGNFSKELYLNGGSNIITYSGIDLAGNTTTGAINIIRNINDYNVYTSTGNTINTGSILFSGTGASNSSATFTSTGILNVASNDGYNNIVLSLSGLTINSNSWDLIFNPPIQTSFSGTFTNTGFTHIDNLSYDMGSTSSELVLSGSNALVNLYVGLSYSGQTLGVFRSVDHGTNYNYLMNCIVSNGICSFNTDQFSLFTLAIPSDSIPDIFTFTDVTNSELSTEHISNNITVSGINTGSIISISNGTYSVNSGSYTSSSGLVNNGDIVNVKLISSTLNSTVTNSILIIGSINDTYTITTKAAIVVSGGGGGGGGGGGITVPVCTDVQLECKLVNETDNVYKWYKNDGISCVGGNLGKICNTDSINIFSNIMPTEKLEAVKYLEKSFALKSSILEKILNDKKKNLINIDDNLSEIGYLSDDLNNLKYLYRTDYNNWIESIHKVDDLLILKDVNSLKLEFKNFLTIYEKLLKYKENFIIKSVKVDGTEIKYLGYKDKTILKIQGLLFNKISSKEPNTYIYRLANKVTYNLNTLLTDKTLNSSDIKRIREKTILIYKDFIKEYFKLANKKVFTKSVINNEVNINENIFTVNVYSIKLKQDINLKYFYAMLEEGDKVKLVKKINDNGLVQVEILTSRIQNYIGRIGYIYDKYLK